jgi:type II secretory pathway pseudopilin PulG
MPLLSAQKQSYRWLLAELVVVVLGVLIALAATAWYESYQEQTNEEALLGQFRFAIQRESDEFESRIQRFSSLKSDVDDLIHKLDSNSIEPSTPYPGYASLLQYLPYSLDFSDYEVLKSIGLTVISNSELRTKLAEFYEFHYPGTAAAWQAEAVRVRGWLEPFILENFKALGNNEWVPFDSNALQSNAVFRNASILKSERIEQQIRRHHEVNDAALEILELIEHELD